MFSSSYLLLSITHNIGTSESQESKFSNKEKVLLLAPINPQITRACKSGPDIKLLARQCDLGVTS